MKIQLWKVEKMKRIYDKDDFDNNDQDDYEDKTNLSIDADEINIDEYLNDETPDYKLQANNYSDDDEDRECHWQHK
jgi:RNA polymerase sigma-54 factor